MERLQRWYPTGVFAVSLVLLVASGSGDRGGTAPPTAPSSAGTSHAPRPPRSEIAALGPAAIAATAALLAR